MRGNRWLAEQERIAPGFLKRAYGDRTYTEAHDAEVALELAPMAKLHGAELTREIVGKGRLEVGMKRRSSPRRGLEKDGHNITAPVTQVDDPQSSLPGVTRESQIERALWALHGEIRALRIELAAHRRIA
jgi:hypothetical protein